MTRHRAWIPQIRSRKYNDVVLTVLVFRKVLCVIRTLRALSVQLQLKGKERQEITEECADSQSAAAA